MIECKSTGLVYRNPRPYVKSIHAWHPSLVVLPSGELIATFDLGEAVESLDYRTYLARSTDGGATWSEPAPFIDDSGHPGCTHCVRTSLMSTGEIVGFGARSYNDPEKGILNHDNLGHVPMDVIFTRSSDDGRTWADLTTIDPPLEGPAFEICHSVIELKDGRWLAPNATWRGADGAEPNGLKTIHFVSHDQGKTWPEYLEIFDGTKDRVQHWEQSTIELADGRLLTVAWRYNETTGRSEPTPYNIAADGRNYGTPRLTGLNGQTAKLVQLPDERILCLYRRDDKPGLWANLSRLDGEEWVNLEEASVWTGAASGMVGEGASADELSALKFGYPQPHLLADGDVMVVFWCCEDCVHNIRWVRLGVD